MSEAATTPCPQCQILQQQLQALQQQVQNQQAAITKLQTQLAAKNKNSSTSSKPPSSDLVKPPSSTDSPRAAGGQPGHLHHQRALFPPEALNGGCHSHQLPACPCCGHALVSLGTPPRIVQQLDIQDVPLRIEEHRSFAGWCPHCDVVHHAPLPISIERGGLVGPRLTTLIAYLKGVCHASFSTVRKFLRDVVGVTISRGQLSKIVSKVSAALDQPYQELLSDLPGQAVLNVDETGHKDNGERWWTWCFRASLYTLFKIDPTRSGDVLLTVLGEEFDGVLGCDYFSAYRRYMRECSVMVQFCLAHLIREVRFLTTLPDRSERAYGERLIEAFKELFGVIHRRESLSEKAFAKALSVARQQVLRVGMEAVPSGKHSQNLAERFEKHGESYFRFVTTPGVEPTNNLAEQAIRFVVIDRHITQGTRSSGGRQWCERIWTVIATCAQQGRSVFEYLRQAVEAHFGGEAAPSLLGIQ
jgi:transposase